MELAQIVPSSTEALTTACNTEIERPSSASTAVASARVSSMPRALRVLSLARDQLD